ncbi:MAG: MATE family efflux transporter [Clostridia bacterium]
MKHKDSDMTTGIIWKQLVSFSVPMAIGLLFQQLYNTVDTIVVGQFVGKEALAAVGSTSSIINMLVGACAGLATGTSVMVSQCYGAHDHRRLHDAVHTTIAATLLLSVLMTGLGLLLVDPMLHLMAMPADVYGAAKEYLTIYFAGIGGLLIYNMGSGILRAVGDSRRPLYFLCFSAIVNVVFDLLFVIQFHMGVAGVAYATILSQFLSAMLVLFLLSNDGAPYGIRWRELRIHRSMLKGILSIGLPSGIQQAITSFSNVFVQSYINFFGSACMAGWSSFNKIDVFMLIPLQAIALASTTFVGQNVGAGKLSRAHRGVKQALSMSLLITAVLAVMFMLYARPLINLFTPDAEVIDFGVRFALLISPFYLASCFNQIYAGALRGAGNAKIPMFIMLFSFVLFRQGYLYVAKLAGNSFVSIALGYPLGWVVCSLLLMVFYQKSALNRAGKEAERSEKTA